MSAYIVEVFPRVYLDNLWLNHPKSKAEKALTPLGYKIIGVKEVSLSELSIPYPRPMYDMAYGAMEKSAAPTPIFTSDQDVSNSVNVVFLIGSN